MDANNYGIITLAICLGYGFILQRLTGRRSDNRVLLKAFFLVFCIGLAANMALYLTMTSSEGRTMLEWLQVIYFSVQHTLEMFVANTLAFKSPVQTTFLQHPLLFMAYMTSYFLAIITSAMVIFHYVSRWAYGRRWLNKKKNIKAAEAGNNHIFLGINRASELLAKDIRKAGHEGKIIFIDIPDNEVNPKGLSVWDIISGFISRSNHQESCEADVILRASSKMKGLVPWLENRDNNVYILSEDQKKNLKLLERLWKGADDPDNEAFHCKIFCHADKDGIVSRYDTVTDIHDRIRFVDSSYLAVESLKSYDSPEMFPYNFVDVATDPKTGRRLGYIESGFTSAILGFGETGQEALKFLYEFGAFAGKDRKKAQFRCHIYDSNATAAAGEFRRKVTLEDTDEVNFKTYSVETPEFWNDLEGIIDSVNYIVVCLGDDTLNLKIAIDIAEFALCKGRDLTHNFVIAVKQTEYKGLDKETFKKAGRTFSNCIRPFGMSEGIWTLRVINNDHLDSLALQFYSGYMALTSKEDALKAWKERNTRLCDDNYEVRAKARRQIAQDYSNCLHSLTKKALCDPQTASASACILKEFDGKNHLDTACCTKFDGDVLETLAIGEHIRWNASHIILGYRHDTITSDLKGTHRYLVPYDSLDEVTKHYDWLVIKGSL